MEGYTSLIANRAIAFCNLRWPCRIALARSESACNSTGEAIICNPEGEIVLRGHGGADEISINDALKKWQHRGLEKNLYKFGHQGYIAVEEGAQDCPQPVSSILSRVNTSSMVSNMNRGCKPITDYLRSAVGITC